jgi:hypothetical protein
MNPTTLSKSRFKIALKSLAEGGHQVGSFAKLIYPGGPPPRKAKCATSVSSSAPLGPSP